MTEERKDDVQACSVTERTQDDCRCDVNGKDCVNSHFTLAVIAVCLSCFTGFFSIPLALAALILSLRAQDQAKTGQTEDARRTAFWVAVFGWVTILIAVIPIIAVLFFGGAILAFLTAMLSAA